MVTGGNGFLGRHLRAELRRQTAALVYAPTRTEFDLCKEDGARTAFDFGVEFVFHLAARVGGIGDNACNPAKACYENTLINTHVVHQAMLHGVGKILCMGSACMYPKFCPPPFNETALWDGYPEETNAPYGLSKRMLLLQLQAYREQYGLNGVMLIAANLYGEGDDFSAETSHAIPAIIKKLSQAKRNGERTVTLWGDGSASRDFLHVQDCISALLLVAEFYDESQPINIGTGCETTIRDVAGQIKALTGYQGDLLWDTTKPNGQPRRALDVHKATTAGWQAQVALDKGLERTVSWYRATA